jgi:hypothetical protein
MRMKRAALFLTAFIVPMATLAAAPDQSTGAREDAPWVWCTPDAQGRAGAGVPERAELLISGTSVSGRLLVAGREYARIEGVLKPASENTGTGGAVTKVWEITASEITGGDGAAGPRTIALTGSYTKHESAGRDAGAADASYEMLALSAAGQDNAAVIISRLQPASPLRFAAR